MRPKQGKILIGIVTYNSESYIKNCIDSTLSQRGISYDLIIIDNNSTDKTVSIIRKSYPTIKLIQNKKNEGTSKTWNYFLRECLEKDYAATIILNADIILQKDFLVNLVSSLIKKEEIGVAFPLQYNYDGSSYEKKFTEALKKQNPAPKEIQKSKDDIEVGWLPAPAIAIKKECIEKIGLFNPIFFMYFEEFNYCRKAIRNKLKVVLSIKSVIYHKGGWATKNGFTYQLSRYTSELVDPGISFFLIAPFTFFKLSARAIGGLLSNNCKKFKFYSKLFFLLSKKIFPIIITRIKNSYP